MQFSVVREAKVVEKQEKLGIFVNRKMWVNSVFRDGTVFVEKAQDVTLGRGV